MSDSLIDGRTLWTFNVLDDSNREGLGIEVDQSLPSAQVIRALGKDYRVARQTCRDSLL